MLHADWSLTRAVKVGPGRPEMMSWMRHFCLVYVLFNGVVLSVVIKTFHYVLLLFLLSRWSVTAVFLFLMLVLFFLFVVREMSFPSVFFLVMFFSMLLNLVFTFFFPLIGVSVLPILSTSSSSLSTGCCVMVLELVHLPSSGSCCS